MTIPIVGIMGPGEGATGQEMELAYELGRQVALAGWVVLTGGRDRGVMDAASRGAKSAGGLTVGILPGSDRSQMSPAIDIPILTGMGNARNAINVLSSDVIIACGMGTGTASELALALKSGKSVILLGATQESRRFFQSLLAERVLVVSGVESAIELMRRLLRPEV